MAQVVGRSRGPGPVEVGRRGHGEKARLPAEADRDHVLRQGLAQAHAGVEPLRHDVDQPSFRNDVDRRPGMALQEHRHDVSQQQTSRRFGSVEAHRPARAVPERVQFAQRGVEVAQGRQESPQEVLAGLGRRDAPGGAVEQPDPEIVFEGSQRVAHGGGGQAEFVGRPPKTAVRRNRREGFQVVERRLRHCWGFFMRAC